MPPPPPLPFACLHPGAMQSFPLFPVVSINRFCFSFRQIYYFILFILSLTTLQITLYLCREWSSLSLSYCLCLMPLYSCLIFRPPGSAIDFSRRLFFVALSATSFLPRLLLPPHWPPLMYRCPCSRCQPMPSRPPLSQTFFLQPMPSLPPLPQTFFFHCYRLHLSPPPLAPLFCGFCCRLLFFSVWHRIATFSRRFCQSVAPSYITNRLFTNFSTIFFFAPTRTFCQNSEASTNKVFEVFFSLSRMKDASVLCYPEVGKDSGDQSSLIEIFHGSRTDDRLLLSGADDGKS